MFGTFSDSPKPYGIPLPNSTSAMSSTAANTSAGAGSGAQGTSLEPNRLEATSSVKMSPDTQIKSFTLFPRFPVELRNMVWDLAACDPRIVEIGGYQTKNKRMRKKEFRFTSKTLVPSVLHVCSESRACGVKHYEKLSFGKRFTGTFINWTVDFGYLQQRTPSVPVEFDTKLGSHFQRCQEENYPEMSPSYLRPWR